MAACGASEVDAVAVEVGDFQAENHLAERGLVGRTFHERFVKPGGYDGEQGDDAAAEDHVGQCEAVAKVVGVEAAGCEAAESEQGFEREQDNAHEDCVDDDGDDADPKTSVVNELGNGVAGDGCGIAGCRCGRWNLARRGCGGGIEGRAASAAELSAGIVCSTTLVAEERCIHGGKYKCFSGKCKGWRTGGEV